MWPFFDNFPLLEPITLHTHDTSWPTTFALEKQSLLNTLKQPSLQLYHVGSTAVPDLLAKPIIDIAIEAAIFPPTPAVIQLLAAIGYEYRGEGGVEGRHWFTKGSPREFNLHYCILNSPVVKSQVAFRDSLIRNETLRREYEQIKINNAAGRDIDDPAYARAKSPLINKILIPGL
jgi:GrpB-like predicted nucleotidyltransferase (UPF0157 family)